jgi:hypothetical protein
MINKFTPVEIAKAVRKHCSNCLITLSPALIVGNSGPYVKATFVKMLYIITGNCSAGSFALRTFTTQMLANSQIAQTAAWEEL